MKTMISSIYLLSRLSKLENGSLVNYLKLLRMVMLIQVMLEMQDESELLGGITAIEAVPGVVSATMVFHQVEAEEERARAPREPARKRILRGRHADSLVSRPEKVLGLASRHVHQVYVDGTEGLIGYLGQLMCKLTCQGRPT